MMRLGFFALIATSLTLGVLLLATTAPSGRVQASEETANCRTIQVPVDNGYGVSAMQTRRVCG